MTDITCEALCGQVCFDEEGLYELVNNCCSCDSICDIGQGRTVSALILLFFTLILLSMKRCPLLPVGRALGTGCCAVAMSLVAEVTNSSNPHNSLITLSILITRLILNRLSLQKQL